MTDYTIDFENLIRKGYEVYAEYEDDNTIYVEAHNRADDTDIVIARYRVDGVRISYNAENFVKNIISLLNPVIV